MNRNTVPSKLFLSLSLALGTAGLALPLHAANDADRTVGTVIDDATITASVKTKLLEDERTEGFDINVDTRNGVVTLRGGADSLADKSAAETLARSVDGVTGVTNLIVVAAEGTVARTEANSATASGEVRKGAKTAAEATEDGWLTTKVKTQLLADDDIKGLDIDVDTKGNVVHLSGVVPTAEMRARAIATAERTEGVVSVDASRLVVRGS
ncbi:BON domain-containing protein [Pseudomarimonas salicorniae]|uniref:BON domain-containing protein n=1 Tax=Pseudomarimonas salicorniae TaxID=2933270 RepID=A0ABT0GFB8_9GAMM|nr:BON domain-containing protein [Lysobacter sp. CAU 1642]MCK7593238.1 BON domain-containing protein [Lysobacter sp. CAU 1642]